MISAGDFKNGITLEIDGNVCQIVEFQHVKPGKGAAFVRTKYKNIITGAVLEKSFRPTEKFPQARIDLRPALGHENMVDARSLGRRCGDILVTVVGGPVGVDLIGRTGIAVHQRPGGNDRVVDVGLLVRVEVTGAEGRGLSGDLRDLLDQQLGALGPGDGSDMVEMRVEVEELLARGLHAEMRPIAHARGIGVGEFRIGNVGRLRMW